MNINTPILTSTQEKNAPWNEKTPPLKGFPACVSQTLSKSVVLYTTNYSNLSDNVTDLDSINWEEEYGISKHYTPLKLIYKFKKFLLSSLPDPVINPAQYKEHQHLIKECEGWISDEFEVYGD